MDKEFVRPGKPYSAGVKAGNMIFVSGQVPTDKDGKTIGNDIKEQTEIVLNKIKSVLEEFGAGVSDIVKCTVYLTDITLFGKMNEAYIDFFEKNGYEDALPSRAAMEISKLMKDDWLIEIEAIAIKD